MTRSGCRSPGGVLLAMTGTALLWLTATITPAFTVGVDTVTRAVALLDNEAWIMNGTGPCCVTATTPWSVPPDGYIKEALDRFIAGTIAPANIGPHYSIDSSYGLPTPEQLHPFTGLDSLPFDISVQQGADALNDEIEKQTAAGNNMVAFGYSQSATIITRELDYLATLPADQRPSTDQLAFVLIGDGNNPDGGFLERFDGADIPSLVAFSGATPDDVYPTDIFTLEYDGWADFPKYPLNVLADLNALLGMGTVHGTYPILTSEQLAAAVELPAVGDTMTHYWMIPTENLPLLLPLEQLGAPQWLIDLIQPDLTVIVNLGYGDPEYGWSTGPANVPTLAGLFPTDINPITVIEDLVKGTAQGASNALADLGLPGLPTQITSSITDLETSLGVLAGQTEPVIQAISASLQHALNNVTVPAQLADALGPVSAALNGLDTAVSHVINDEIDPLIQQAVYAVGDPLRDALTSAGAADQLTNAVYIAEQVLPIFLEAPGNFVTNDLHFLADGVTNLVDGNFAGFVQQLELIPAGDFTMGVMMGIGLPFLTLESILTGSSLALFS